MFVIGAETTLQKGMPKVMVKNEILLLVVGKPIQLIQRRFMCIQLLTNRRHL